MNSYFDAAVTFNCDLFRDDPDDYLNSLCADSATDSSPKSDISTLSDPSQGSI
jgi:hypothetical protein